MSLHHAHLPGTPARNGLPERVNYAYQGTGSDVIPLSSDALAPYKGGYEQWLPEFARGNSRRKDTCKCGYKWLSQNCRALCGAP
jgi:hypothetical protein